MSSVVQAVAVATLMSSETKAHAREVQARPAARASQSGRHPAQPARPQDVVLSDAQTCPTCRMLPTEEVKKNGHSLPLACGFDEHGRLIRHAGAIAFDHPYIPDEVRNRLYARAGYEPHEVPARPKLTPQE